MLPVCFLSLFFLAHDMPVIERDLLAKYQRIDYWAADTSADPMARVDSLDSANTGFQRALLSVARKYPGSLGYDFKLLQDAGVVVTTSSDGRFRVYSWDTETGGTMHFFRKIYQWLGDHHVHAKAVEVRDVDDFCVDAGESDDFCAKIYTVDNHYLAVNNSILSSSEGYEALQAFAIDKGKLNDSVHLFKTQTGLKNEVGFDYDFFSTDFRQDLPLILTRYNASTKTVYIPVVLPEGKVTHRWITYRWTGGCFEKAR